MTVVITHNFNRVYCNTLGIAYLVVLVLGLITRIVMLPFKYRGPDYIFQTRCLSPRLLICLISIMCIKTLFKDLKFSSNSAFECIRCLHPFIYLKGVDDVAHNRKTPSDCNGISLQKKGYREPSPREYIRLRREW